LCSGPCPAHSQETLTLVQRHASTLASSRDVDATNESAEGQLKPDMDLAKKDLETCPRICRGGGTANKACQITAAYIAAYPPMTRSNMVCYHACSTLGWCGVTSAHYNGGVDCCACAPTGTDFAAYSSRYRGTNACSPTPAPTSDCSGYMVGTGCGWTSSYNCPGQTSGSQGAAGDDGSLGYDCCCRQGLWQATTNPTSLPTSSPTSAPTKPPTHANENGTVGSKALCKCSNPLQTPCSVLDFSGGEGINGNPLMGCNGQFCCGRDEGLCNVGCKAAPTAAPTTKPPTHAVSCQSWCATSTRDWATKCKFAACSACAQFDCKFNDPGQLKPGGQFCAQWCPISTRPWQTKCTFEQACADCVAC
jgi:hypothetical protein